MPSQKAAPSNTAPSALMQFPMGHRQQMKRSCARFACVQDLEAEGKASCGASEEDQHTGVKELKRWLLPGSTGELKVRANQEKIFAASPFPALLYPVLGLAPLRPGR